MKALGSPGGNGIATHTFTSKLIKIKLSHQIYSCVKMSNPVFPQKYSAYT